MFSLVNSPNSVLTHSMDFDLGAPRNQKSQINALFPDRTWRYFLSLRDAASVMRVCLLWEVGGVQRFALGPPGRAVVKSGGGCQDGGQRGGDPHCPAKGGWRTQRLLPAVCLGRENGTPWIGRGSGSGRWAAQLALKAGGEQLRWPYPCSVCSLDFCGFMPPAVVFENMLMTALCVRIVMHKCPNAVLPGGRWPLEQFLLLFKIQIFPPILFILALSNPPWTSGFLLHIKTVAWKYIECRAA